MRLFVALYPPPATRAELAGWAEDGGGLRPAPADQIHLTLRFLGDVPDEQLPAIEEALATVAVAPFWLEIGGVGAFPPRGRPKVVWAGLSRHHPFLHRLRQQVDDAMLRELPGLEIPSFVPHLTLARTAGASPGAVADWLKRHRDAIGPAWHVDAFALMASTLSATGARHETVRHYPLRA